MFRRKQGHEAAAGAFEFYHSPVLLVQGRPICEAHAVQCSTSAVGVWPAARPCLRAAWNVWTLNASGGGKRLSPGLVCTVCWSACHQQAAAAWLGESMEKNPACNSCVNGWSTSALILFFDCWCGEHQMVCLNQGSGESAKGQTVYFWVRLFSQRHLLHHIIYKRKD